MSDIRELYQQTIVDHGRHPRNFGRLEHANHVKEGYNPLCGDRLTLYILEKAGIIDQITFEGSGCAISMAAASLMTEAMKGKTIAEADRIFHQFHELMLGHAEVKKDLLGKLVILAGVAEFPVRVKCATLSWHTLMAALHNDSELVSTE